MQNLESTILYTKDELIFLRKEQIIKIHDLLIEKFKAELDPISRGIRHEGQIDFLQAKLQNKTYKGAKIEKIIQLSAEIMFDILCRHPFTDGNKRTALFIGQFTLFTNLLIDKQLSEEYEKNIKEISNSQINLAKLIEKIASWYDGSEDIHLINMLKEKGIDANKTIKENHIKQYLELLLFGLIQKVVKEC